MARHEVANTKPSGMGAKGPISGIVITPNPKIRLSMPKP